MGRQCSVLRLLWVKVLICSPHAKFVTLSSVLQDSHQINPKGDLKSLLLQYYYYYSVLNYLKILYYGMLILMTQVYFRAEENMH